MVRELWYNKSMDGSEVLGYVAGVLDGEGCVQLQVNKKSWANISVTINNTNQELVDYINLLLPGTIYTPKSHNPKHKVCYRLTWNGEDAVLLLELLLPYLIVKRSVAEKVLEFWENCGMSGRAGKHIALNEAESILRRSYADRVKEMNKRGL